MAVPFMGRSVMDMHSSHLVAMLDGVGQCTLHWLVCCVQYASAKQCARTRSFQKLTLTCVNTMPH